MDIKFKRLLDQIGIKILHELQMDARISYSELGRRVGLSSPAVTERVRKLEDAGIICGYHIKIDREKTGFPILAFIFLTAPLEQDAAIYTFINETSEIIEFHSISGNESFFLRVITASVSRLDDIVEKLNIFGETRTSIVLSSRIEKTAIEIKDEM